MEHAQNLREFARRAEDLATLIHDDRSVPLDAFQREVRNELPRGAPDISLQNVERALRNVAAAIDDHLRLRGGE